MMHRHQTLITPLGPVMSRPDRVPNRPEPAATFQRTAGGNLQVRVLGLEEIWDASDRWVVGVSLLSLALLPFLL